MSADVHPAYEIVNPHGDRSILLLCDPAPKSKTSKRIIKMFYVAFLHAEPGESGYGVSFPDFPGCVSGGDTPAEAVTQGARALAMHVRAMRDDSDAIPEPRSVEDIEADADLADWRAGATLAFVPLIEDHGSPKRVNVSLDPGLLEAIDEAASARGMTRSAFLTSAARRELLGA